MTEVSVLLPYRESAPWRAERFEWIKERLLALGFEICIGDTPGEFSRSGARNAAAAKASHDMFIICDADTFCNTHTLIDTIENANVRGWALPYGRYYNLGEEQTQRLLEGSPHIEVYRPTEFEFDLESTAGIIAMRRDLFESFGGYDENFVGWGYEDNAFYIAAETFGGPPARQQDGFVCHLWHPAPESVRFGSPTIHVNRRRYERYNQSRGRKDAILKLKEIRA